MLTVFCIVEAICMVRSAVVPPAPQVMSQNVGFSAAIRSCLVNRFSTPCTKPWGSWLYCSKRAFCSYLCTIPNPRPIDEKGYRATEVWQQVLCAACWPTGLLINLVIYVKCRPLPSLVERTRRNRTWFPPPLPSASCRRPSSLRPFLKRL